MQNNEQAIQEAMRLAQSPAGQQLLSKLKESGGDELRQAMNQAAAGDYTQAMQALNGLLESPDIKKLLEQLRR